MAAAGGSPSRGASASRAFRKRRPACLRSASLSETLSSFREPFGSSASACSRFASLSEAPAFFREPFGNDWAHFFPTRSRSCGSAPLGRRKRRRRVSFRIAPGIAAFLKLSGGPVSPVPDRFRNETPVFLPARSGTALSYPTWSEGGGAPSAKSPRGGRMRAEGARRGAFIGEQACLQRPTTCGFARDESLTCTFTGSTKA